jgi:beta-galactosidase
MAIGLKLRILMMGLITMLFTSTSYASVTDTLSLNGIWKFKTDLYKNGVEQQWYKLLISKDSWDKMEVPGNWDLHNEYADYTGDAWYSYTFNANESWTGKNLRLVFQSVYNDSEVWLNGNKVGENHFGFLQFYFDVSKYLLIGQKNEIVVKVNNVFKKGAIWNWGGIRRPVWLEITNPVRINSLAITPIPDLQKQNASIQIKAEVANYSSKPADLSFGVEVFYKNKSIYISGIQKALSVKENELTTLAHTLNLSKGNTHLWHFDHPELYTAKVSIYSEKQLLHTYEDRFGIRKIEIDGIKLKLNGEEIRLVGFNLVPEDRVTGNTLPFDRIKKIVDMLKEAGANMARISHMSLPKEFLDYLDERGIMTFEEVTLWGKDILVDPANPLPKLWLEKLIKQEYNHPSIIGWSVGNEIGTLNKNPLASDYIKGAIENAKRLDPNRLAVYVSNSVQSQDNDPSVYSDLIMQNTYGGWLNAAEKAHAKFPNKPIFMSEFGLNLIGENLEANADFNKMLSGLRTKDYLIGASLWTFNDYRSNYWSAIKSWESPPSHNRTWGVVNTFLQKKKAFYTIQKEFLPLKILNISSGINENAFSGKIVLKPNEKPDFPAYQLKNYHFVIKALNANQELKQTEIKLPVLNPGDGIKSFAYSLGLTNSTSAVKISLVDAQNYTRFDTTIYINQPLAGLIKTVHTSTNAARIVFERSPTAAYYTLKYGEKGLDKETAAVSINNFFDLKDLKEKATYQYQLVAHNNKGIKTTEISTFTLDESELPPIIWGVEPVKNGFFISFSGDPLDYRYEVEYGTVAGKYDKLLTINTHGVLQIPNLETDKTYFFRLRRVLQWGFASEWTNEMKVKTL